MTNPFEDPEGAYYALVNDADQYSLWPAQIQVPEGWTIAHGPADRKSCLDFIEENWTDLRPANSVS
ncbi:MbtH family protein [Saccharopolyspora rectivirgula]|uniref:Antibiotic synthesis protein MbtH n=1 Tax=Saccharopolyspora rectivirgula TaxID=28042 RepID=A0A073AYG1_9PSEU|nr:MbtH family protein [Saccharopolyspora rectivirgula]KEI44087.1 antibiotic synthesis protein MbtH [Saccharopolyspora rectivirgula]